MSDNFYSQYPHADSMLFAMDNESDSFSPSYGQSSTEGAPWDSNDSLSNGWDHLPPLSPTLGGGASLLDDYPFATHNESPLMAMPPLFPNTVPSINIDTSVATPYMNSLAPNSSLTSTPLTPGFISPSAPGYMSSPSLQDLTPPTPAHQLSNHDNFYGSLSSTPVSPFVHSRPEWQLAKPAPGSSRPRASSTNDLSPVSAGIRGPLVPQKRYKPHTSSDRRRYVDEVNLEPSIHFFMQKPDEEGISLSDAMHNRFARLVERDQPMFVDRGPSISVRINWPGYQPWSRQIPTRDFRNPPGPITRAKLAKNVAKSVQRFITEHKNRPMEEDGDEEWMVGPHKIDLFDLVLVRLDHVSKGSWQAQLQLLRPR